MNRTQFRLLIPGKCINTKLWTNVVLNRERNQEKVTGDNKKTFFLQSFPIYLILCGTQKIITTFYEQIFYGLHSIQYLAKSNKTNEVNS